MDTSGAQNNNVTVGQLARKNYKYAEAFKKLGIDYCCGGKKTVEEVCHEKGLDMTLVQEALEKATQTHSGAVALDFNAWPASFLTDYIINVHHKYVTDSFALLDELSEKVARKHADRYAELTEIRETVVALLQELKEHLQKEETILFPYIKQLEGALSTGNTACFDTVQKPIWAMEQEHEDAGNLLRMLRRLTNSYTPPPNACNSFNLLYKKLEEFEQDLHQHIHLENNILFPKAIQLEEAL